MVKIIKSYYLKLDFEVEIDFSLLNSHVYTTLMVFEDIISSLQIDSEEQTTYESNERTKFLVIQIETEIEDYASSVDSSAKARPLYLIILSILTFITGRIFTVFQSSSSSLTSSSETWENSFQVKDIDSAIFIYEGCNQSDELKKILRAIQDFKQSERRLIYSLLDRWRKGLYLEIESSDSFLYEDETLLAYFHVLELLASQFKAELIKESEDISNEFLNKILVDIFKVKERNLEEQRKAKLKLIKEVIISEIPVATTILYMLDKLKMLNARSQEIVEKLVKDRNAIAHGRQVYQEKVIFPVPPFFPLVKDITNEIEIAKIITARAIAAYLNLEIWKDQWDNRLRDLPPAYETVQEFVQNKLFLNIPAEEFLNANYEVSLSDISYWTIRGKIKVQELEEIIQELILDMKVHQDNVWEVLEICLLLADSTDIKLREKCRYIVEYSYENKWVSRSDLRDSAQNFGYLGFSIKWISQWLSNYNQE